MQRVIINYRIRNLDGKFPAYTLEGLPYNEYKFAYGVSVGNDHFENDWVSGYVNFIKSTGCRKVCVLVADTLQRHNLSCFYDNAYEKSLENGRIWVNKYRPMFDQLGNEVECQFVHWNQYLEHPDFHKYLKYMRHLAATDHKFQACLDESISAYLGHGVNREINCTVEERRQRSAEYFIEECAVFWIMAQDPELKGDLYPSKPLPIISYTYELINREMRQDNQFLCLQIREKKGYRQR